ncbi:MAG: GTP-binding protein, partial [bacterium]|nr:GTP-binding protein [bacterium]
AQERERGITILAKNTAIRYRDVKINIIDTPGHADFSGEVERTLTMADGALLVIDAQEGPMPQTKFVLKKALELGLTIIVVVNKIDKRDANIERTVSRMHDLFLELASHESQLDFPVYYAIGREGKAWETPPTDPSLPADLTPIFEGILRHIPPPRADAQGPFQFLVTTLDWDDFLGKYAIGRITRGTAVPSASVLLLKKDGNRTPARIERVFVSRGLKREEVSEATAGDIVALTGIGGASIGDTIADAERPEALPAMAIAEPTVTMSIGPNTSPFAGREGTYVTGRQLLERIQKELETNVSLRMTPGDSGNWILSGRGELHLSVFLENLRREDYEMQVGKPRVITKVVDGQEVEPVEELTITVAKEHLGAVAQEVGRRRGFLQSQEEESDGTMRLQFEITTRGLLGLRSQLLTVSRGTAVMSSQFVRFAPVEAAIPQLRNGVLIASDPGKAVAYGLNIAQGRGVTFLPPQTEVYAGMIVGLNTRQEDIEINVTKEKRLSNMRASGSDEALQLTPPVIMSLEQHLDFLNDDELLEITPKSLRLRKALLDSTARKRATQR